jgi:hypothetical protein
VGASDTWILAHTDFSDVHSNAGALSMLIFLPLTIFGLYFACNDQQCISLNPLSDTFLQGKSVSNHMRI